jgi:hypothetical protein
VSIGLADFRANPKCRRLHHVALVLLLSTTGSIVPPVNFHPQYRFRSQQGNERFQDSGCTHQMLFQQYSKGKRVVVGAGYARSLPNPFRRIPEHSYQPHEEKQKDSHTHQPRFDAIEEFIRIRWVLFGQAGSFPSEMRDIHSWLVIASQILRQLSIL